jgi:hypothetical protein
MNNWFWLIGKKKTDNRRCISGAGWCLAMHSTCDALQPHRHDSCDPSEKRAHAGERYVRVGSDIHKVTRSRRMHGALHFCSVLFPRLKCKSLGQWERASTLEPQIELHSRVVLLSLSHSNSRISLTRAAAVFDASVHTESVAYLVIFHERRHTQTWKFKRRSMYVPLACACAHLSFCPRPQLGGGGGTLID